MLTCLLKSKSLWIFRWPEVTGRSGGYKFVAYRYSLVSSLESTDPVFGLIRGKNMEDGIVIASDYVNYLDSKVFGDDALMFCRGTYQNLTGVFNVLKLYGSLSDRDFGAIRCMEKSHSFPSRSFVLDKLSDYLQVGELVDSDACWNLPRRSFRKCFFYSQLRGIVGGGDHMDVPNESLGSSQIPAPFLVKILSPFIYDLSRGDSVGEVWLSGFLVSAGWVKTFTGKRSLYSSSVLVLFRVELVRGSKRGAIRVFDSSKLVGSGGFNLEPATARLIAAVRELVGGIGCELKRESSEWPSGGLRWLGVRLLIGLPLDYLWELVCGDNSGEYGRLEFLVNLHLLVAWVSESSLGIKWRKVFHLPLDNEDRKKVWSRGTLNLKGFVHYEGLGHPVRPVSDDSKAGTTMASREKVRMTPKPCTESGGPASSLEYKSRGNLQFLLPLLNSHSDHRCSLWSLSKFGNVGRPFRFDHVAAFNKDFKSFVECWDEEIEWLRAGDRLTPSSFIKPWVMKSSRAFSAAVSRIRWDHLSSVYVDEKLQFNRCLDSGRLGREVFNWTRQKCGEFALRCLGDNHLGGKVLVMGWQGDPLLSFYWYVEDFWRVFISDGLGALSCDFLPGTPLSRLRSAALGRAVFLREGLIEFGRCFDATMPTVYLVGVWSAKPRSPLIRLSLSKLAWKLMNKDSFILVSSRVLRKIEPLCIIFASRCGTLRGQYLILPFRGSDLDHGGSLRVCLRVDNLGMPLLSCYKTSGDLCDRTSSRRRLIMMAIGTFVSFESDFSLVVLSELRRWRF
ncbi:hypothetical protein FNV43_RR05920 [Rhamnella rubrinervis]|uniref:Uncharacterized protein n=1 Tax=Rhamnella rubrinervis TaxID=2594499 RepID=A0A8K0MKU4_9ROSA|nr:hypothetical protein FNV43_RR05920 [Rhamnella rubrinervis]